MLILHHESDFVEKNPNEIYIKKSVDGFSFQDFDGSTREVQYTSVVMMDLKYPCEIITKIVGRSTTGIRVNITVDAFSLVMKACETNRIFF